METPGVLHSLAEVAITLAGFAALIAVFKRDKVWSSSELTRVNATIFICFSAVVAAVLPDAIPYFTNSEAVRWGLPLLIIAIATSQGSVRMVYRSFTGGYRWTGLPGMIMTYLQFPIGAMWLLSALDTLIPRSPGMLILGVLYLLFLTLTILAVSIAELTRDKQN